MHESSFQVLFLGEDLAWSKISGSLDGAARANLKVHRAQSLNELFLILAGGEWHAAAVDVQAWNFQGLHYVDKIRSEYPAFPILALHSASSGDLAVKATTSGATCCLTLEGLNAKAIHTALLSCVSERKSRSHLRNASSVQVTFDTPESSSVAASKAQVISHALNNLMCVITANADILSEHLDGSGPGARSLEGIKKAAKSASDLMRLLK
jgi:DNA-binding NtrC family response regulator